MDSSQQLRRRYTNARRSGPRLSAHRPAPDDALAQLGPVPISGNLGCPSGCSRPPLLATMGRPQVEPRFYIGRFIRVASARVGYQRLLPNGEVLVPCRSQSAGTLCCATHTCLCESRTAGAQTRTSVERTWAASSSHSTASTSTTSSRWRGGARSSRSECRGHGGASLLDPMCVCCYIRSEHRRLMVLNSRRCMDAHGHGEAFAATNSLRL